MKKKLNDLRAARADLIRQAEVIAMLAETENRDLTEAEAKQIDDLVGTEDGAILGQVAELDEQIARYVRVSSLVKNLAEPAGVPPVKPESNGDPKVLKRSEFEKLDQHAKAAFTKAGGVVED